MNSEQVNTFEYRGIKLPIYLDDYGQCLYTEFNGEEISFGTYNADYEDDARYIIDNYLDTILVEHGAKLEWFSNNEYRDIRLKYHGRVVKLWLVEDESEVNLEQIKSEARDIVDKVKKVMR